METAIEIIRKEVKEVVSSFRKISERERQLRLKGYNIEEVPMGSGGVLQEKVMRDGSLRIQIGYGHGRNNYAKAVIFK